MIHRHLEFQQTHFSFFRSIYAPSCAGNSHKDRDYLSSRSKALLHGRAITLHVCDNFPPILRKRGSVVDLVSHCDNKSRQALSPVTNHIEAVPTQRTHTRQFFAGTQRQARDSLSPYAPRSPNSKQDDGSLNFPPHLEEELTRLLLPSRHDRNYNLMNLHDEHTHAFGIHEIHRHPHQLQFAARAKKMLRTADIVMIFGVKPLMPKIAKLVQDECRSGSYLFSYRFPIPLSTQRRTSDVNSKKSGELAREIMDQASGIDAELIYDEEEMRIYQLGSGNEQRDAERRAI
ncbi:hypothetical protein THAOC_00766 [Thalassiosira oceanica]|uniref:Uncharacterized protein n=1 Tax=Thalassiosira oceanica TaxID=159749 RepID=K0TJP8_THAOC|nr:hypothetical protein THAOC_00766 [Thalassiosira oceanica]|eukprot:EJK77404.1 hypothetical protein THAOC_00766 [Thalassiosira oceanica]